MPVVGTRDAVALIPEVKVDVGSLAAFAEAVLSGASPQQHQHGLLGGLAQAGDILPDWDAEWLHAERERFMQVRLHALETLCRHYASIRQFGLAVELCMAAVVNAPLRETAQRELIRVYLAEGNRAEAMRQYREYQRAMQEELGLEASPEIAEMMRR